MPHVLVWGIETIPDLKGCAAVHGHNGKTDDEIREASVEKFLKHIFHVFVDKIAELRPQLVTL
jgi:predicted PolB exonuclease-like 3'-5' exonuclease